MHHLSAELPFPNATKGQKAISQSAAVLGKSAWFCTLSYASLVRLAENSKHNTEIDPELIIKSFGVFLSPVWFKSPDLCCSRAPRHFNVQHFELKGSAGFRQVPDKYWCSWFYFFYLWINTEPMFFGWVMKLAGRAWSLPVEAPQLKLKAWLRENILGDFDA